MAKYALEEGALTHEERTERIAEIRSDKSMSEKEKRERIRALNEAVLSKNWEKYMKINSGAFKVPELFFIYCTFSKSEAGCLQSGQMKSSGSSSPMYS